VFKDEFAARRFLWMLPELQKIWIYDYIIAFAMSWEEKGSSVGRDGVGDDSIEQNVGTNLSPHQCPYEPNSSFSDIEFQSLFVRGYLAR
jgi:hypothetical protein